MKKNEDAFYEYYASESAKQSTVERFQSTKRAVLRVARHFRLPDGPLKVADIGCGAAAQCLLWAQDNHSVFGLDINERLVELGRKRVRDAGLSVDLRVGTVDRSPKCGHYEGLREALSTDGRFGRLRRTGTGRRWSTRVSTPSCGLAPCACCQRRSNCTGVRYPREECLRSAL